MEHGRPTPGQPLNRGETVGGSRVHGIGVSGLNPIRPPKRDHGPRHVEAKHTGDVATSNCQHRGVAHRDVQRRMFGEGFGDEGERLHNQEDKELGVTVRGPASDTGTVGAGSFV
jgi:hypothetical protein